MQTCPSLKLRVSYPRLEEMVQEAEALLDRYVDPEVIFIPDGAVYGSMELVQQ